jgi:cytoskeletal protein RodZ
MSKLQKIDCTRHPLHFGVAFRDPRQIANAKLRAMASKGTLLAWLFVWVCLPVHAQWQWTDAVGRQVFSDRAPPPDIPDKNIIKRPATSPPKSTLLQTSDGLGQGDVTPTTAGAAVPAALPAVSALDRELEAKRQQAAQAQASAVKAAQERNLKVKIENCTRAKQAKATYESGVRIARTNAAGEPEYLDENARSAELKRIQGVVDSDCR